MRKNWQNGLKRLIHIFKADSFKCFKREKKRMVLFIGIRGIVMSSLLLLVLPSFSLFAQDKRPDGFPVVSYRTLDVKKYNKQIIIAEKKQEKWAFSPLSIAMRFHKISDVRFVNINQKNDRAECPLNSVVTIVEEGFLDDQMRGRWTQFHLERKDLTKTWNVRELREAFLCGTGGSKEVIFKDLCPEEKAMPIIDISLEMIPETAEIPCDGFPYTFDVKFKIRANGPGAVVFQRMRSDGAVAPIEKTFFKKAGTKEFYDYFRVGGPGDYWFRVDIIEPNKISRKASSKVMCHEKN